MIRMRSSNGANALFIALIVSHSISPRPIPNAASRAANSLERDTPLISRLSVLSVTRKRRRRSRSIGWSSMDAAAPLWTFDDGHISSGTRRSRTNAASRPSSHGAVVADGDVVDDPDAVAQPLGAAELERLPDRRQPERLAGVDRDVEVLAADEVERVQMAGRPIARLRPGDIEPDDARIAPADGALGDLDRAGGLAHRGDDRASRRSGGRPRRPRPRRRGTRRASPRLDLVEGQATSRAQLRGHPDLGVDDAIGGEVLGAFRGDAGDRVALLHDPERVHERLEIQLQALAVGAAPEPGASARRRRSSAGRRSRTPRRGR